MGFGLGMRTGCPEVFIGVVVQFLQKAGLKRLSELYSLF
jgi:hypothetical protein